MNEAAVRVRCKFEDNPEYPLCEWQVACSWDDNAADYEVLYGDRCRYYARKEDAEDTAETLNRSAPAVDWERSDNGKPRYPVERIVR